jgi:threonine dehydrogenase-like Zn-dependent dehydrogenase
MRALTVIPRQASSAALVDVPEPAADEGSVLVETLSIGVCGTDREIIASRNAPAPDGDERLAIGHESLGRVLEAPADNGLKPGDLVVGIVRRPDPVPCVNCAAGEWDMCRNGLYTECGIRGRHGFARERFRIDPEFAVRVDERLGQAAVLLEPASVLAKAWEQIEYIGRRARWEPKRVLVSDSATACLSA